MNPSPHRGSGRTIRLLFSLCLVAALAAPARPVLATEEIPGWWKQAGAEAVRDGYRIIRGDDLKSRLEAGEDLLLLDVRPDYEFRANHLPGAVNLEFHLGDRNRLSPEKEKALRAALGPDPDRKAVLYCRSYQ